MFDPLTAQLIRDAPELPDLDRERLPEEFTRAFASIVAFRIRLRQTASTQLPAEIEEQLETFRRLAATFEAMVALVPDRSNRRAAAFVAAQAHHLLHLARNIPESQNERVNPLRSEAISPEVSALLLFLIANQPTDAMDLADFLTRVSPPADTITGRLTQALIALARGNLSVIPNLVIRSNATLETDICGAASEALYRRILSGIASLASYLMGEDAQRNAFAEAISTFRSVQKLSIGTQNWPVLPSAHNMPQAHSMFVGPHHLATLLIIAGDFLRESAVAVLPPPDGTSPSTWRGLISHIIAERPFLWPNHVEAIKSGLLNPGTSAVISFPTGAGKTTLSELKTAATLANGGSVIYLVPTHALVNQTKTSLAKAFPETPVRDSLLIEDFYAEADEDFSSTNAQIVVVTPERCLALMSLETNDFSGVKLIVFDECHLIHPKGDGQNRRSLDAMLNMLYLSAAAPHADWLLLSAMMANSDELAAWLTELTNRTCLSLNLDWKPTRQARGCLVYEQSEVDRLTKVMDKDHLAQKKPNGTVPNPGVAVQRKLTATPFGLFCLKQTWQTTNVEDYTLLRMLEQTVPLSASLSTNKKRWYLTPNKNQVAAHLAAECVRIGLKVLLFAQDIRFVMGISETINELLKENLRPHEFSPKCKQLADFATDEVGSSEDLLIPTGRAACHHGLMLAAERELVETMFRNRPGVDAVAATPTLAQGMNFPADIVFIVGDERFDNEAKASMPLEAHEILNAAGRAGRAGHVSQGVVIILPHTLVAFDRQKNAVGQAWMRLQQGVFSRGDQCLPLKDPIGHLIDLIHNGTQDSDLEIRYFLRRLPTTSENDPDAPTKFLRRSFAAYHAKRHNEEAKFEQTIKYALARRAAILPSPATETWRDELAYKTGVQVEFIESLHQELLRITAAAPQSTELWTRWFFGWLGHNPERVKAILGHRLPSRLIDELAQGDLFGGKLTEVVWAWMSGENLNQLNIRLGGKVNKSSHCMHARKFVLRLIPDLAYAAGLAIRVRRNQLIEDGVEEMPISFGVLSYCVREGVSEPEVAALRKITQDSWWSRKKLQVRWKQIQSMTPPRVETERFGHTVKRVKRGLQKVSQQLRNASGQYAD